MNHHLVIGNGREVGGELATNPAVVALSFTGSHAVGSQIYQQLAPRMADRWAAAAMMAVTAFTKSSSIA